MNIFDWTFFLVSKLLPIQVIVKEGVLEGDVMRSRFGSPYYSFKGIPYAEPPVGDLRFKAPVPKTPWAGVRNAKEHAPKCYQHQLNNETRRPIGSEDCLYLNVYAPYIAPFKSLPVMVWIHGGGFVTGSGDDDEQSPEYLMRKEVILVTLNYRLGVLGFLSLDTEDIPGNAGMKDQVAALKWVKENIQKFGGDPDKITIFGSSAGGASVSFHLVSPMSKGLFKRAIVQSGALTCWWAMPFRARDRALALARELGCSSKHDKEMYDCLSAQSAESLTSTQINVTYIQSAKAAINVHFSIVSERQFSENERFFSGHPYDILRDGIHEGVQIMNGYTEDEGTLYFLRVDADEVFEQANKYKEFFVPEPHTTNTSLVTQMEIGERFREFYLGDKIAARETVDEMMKYFNMEAFVYGVMALQKIIAKTTQGSINYLYKFTCKSELNQFVHQTGIDSLFAHRPVVAHADDLPYLFPLQPGLGQEIDMNSNTFKMIDQVTTLWTNFAKYGNPTPDSSLGAKWLPYTVENQDYLDIGEDLVPGTFPEQEDMEFWEDNFKEHLPKLVP